MNDKLPIDPITAMQEAMGGLRELYLSAIEAGFSAAEAMAFIVGIAASARQSPGSK